MDFTKAALKLLGDHSAKIYSFMAILCFSLPVVVGEPQVDPSGLVPLNISEEELPPPAGMTSMYDGSFEGPNGFPPNHSEQWANNTITPGTQILGRNFDVPTGGLPSPLFGAQDFDQPMLRFEEFGSLNNEVGLNPKPFPGTPESNALVGGSFDVDGLPIPAPPLTAQDSPNGLQVEYFLDQPLTESATRLSNDFAENPWKTRIESFLARPTTHLPMEGRPPGEGWAHQRWAEFPPQKIFQTMVTGARTNHGFRAAMQSHGYQHSLAGDDCEFGPGGLYHNTYADPLGLNNSAGTTAGLEVRFHPAMPAQSSEALWTFDGTFPPKLLKARYGEPMLMRAWNGLPIDPAANRGFGLHTVSIHEHNGHNPAESDGYTNSFFFPGQYYDYRWPMILAGHDTINTEAADPRAGMPDGNGGIINIRGDWRETMSSHWFHDHMLDFTAQNVYKGIAAMFNYYSALDRGNEGLDDGVNLRLPSGTSLDWGNRDYDINLMIADKAWDQAGQLWFNPFNTDGFVGDHLLTNWQYKPYLDVAARKYRFRILNGSVSRYLKIAVVDQNNNRVPFHMIANDGNIMEHAVAFDGTNGTQNGILPTQAIAERYDIVIDFSQFLPGDRIYLVNLLEHSEGQAPAGQVGLNSVLNGNYQATATATGYVGGDPCVGKFLELRVQPYTGVDLSMNPAEYVEGGKKMIPLPRPSAAELANATHRTFTFGKSNGTDSQPWTIKTDGGIGFTMDPRRVTSAPSLGDLEIWTLENDNNNWSHPIHIHFEEGIILSKDGGAPPVWERWARKDMYRLGGMPDSCTKMEIAIRFREFAGTYMEHCHNTQHEDRAMLMRWDIENPGQVNLMPSPLPTWEGVEYVNTVALPTFRVGDGTGNVDPIRVPVVGPPNGDDDADGIVNACDPDQTGGLDCDLNGEDDACQNDADLDGLIDPCDPDLDGDSIPNACDIDQTLGADCDQDGQDDSCQLDTDQDGLIDTCDPDLDGDTLPNECDIDQTPGADCDLDGQLDLCQLDTDLDGIIDPCDPDLDGDGITNECDPNQSAGTDCDLNGVLDQCQTDTDSDGTIDPCDPDLDGDGILNGCDIDQNPGSDCDSDGQTDSCQLDTDQDGLIDPCDSDLDGDGIANNCDVDQTGGADCDLNGQDDSCQIDTDADGTIDPCDADLDGDGINNDCDIDQTGGNDCDLNGQDDSCQPDTDADGSIDPCDSDIDGDGLPNECDVDQTGGNDCDLDGRDDTCQTDTDSDGTIDACDGDLDGDGIANACDIDQTGGNDCDFNGQDDTCQPDTDSDGLIDACDNDLDDDGIPNHCDVDHTGGEDCDSNGVSDACQVDTDGDGLINACDSDLDGDGVANICDPDQTGGADCDLDGTDDSCQIDTDADGTIDPCDGDLDGDGIPNECDVQQNGGPDCDNDGQTDSCQTDTDSDGLIDPCDVDLDGDGIPNNCDAHQTGGFDCDSNGQDDSCQFDADSDGTIDPCDADIDGDGILNNCDVDQTPGADCDLNGEVDICQLDTDADGTIDACDSDVDGDGILNDCEVDQTGGLDCDLDGQDDSCQPDTDADGTIDPCDADIDGDGIENQCDSDHSSGEDCNSNGILDGCDLTNGLPDVNNNGIPDECDSGKFIRGDLNGDSSTDITDAILGIQYMFQSYTLDCISAADNNDDGSVDLTDAVYLLSHIFNGTVSIPAPTASCGVDPSLDGLDCQNHGACP